MERSGRKYLNLEIYLKLILFSGNPVLPGWLLQGTLVAKGGKVLDVRVLNGANLGGELGNDLGMFTSIRSIDLSNNRIGGSIPSNLPVTMQNFFLSANNFTGSIPDSISSLTLLTAMSLNNNFLSGEIPDSFQSLAGLINLDLSSNNLSGQLPASFQNLIHLTTLRLQENRLSGTLDVLQDLPLKDLNIENNLFSGPIPEKMLTIPNLRTDGNPFNDTSVPLPSPTSPLTPPPAPGLPGAPTSPSSGKTPGKQVDGPSSSEESSSGGKKSTKKIVWISIAGVLSFVILALGLVLFMPKCSRRREQASRIFERHQVDAYKGNRENPRDHESLLLAVKKLDKKASSQQNDDEFIELVNNVDRIRNANVVELMGFCAEHGQRLLIYEYCSNGTLQDALHSDDESKKQLSWNARVRMALGAARALEYLHEICQPPVVHRNFKSANILLDDDLAVRVSDCGLAPLISSNDVSQNEMNKLFSNITLCLRAHFGRLIEENLIAFRTRNRGEQFLVRWAVPQLHDIDALSRMVDPSLNGEYPAKSLSNFADIISRCVQTQPEFRPSMSEVVQDLLDMIRRERHSSESIGD
ncbi:hypothetical protein GH714_043528 [Hevea brasiliensis]|uniref:Protein kinase domain-containing protein n=1 Tax=Hevea brasiliensis TaxID=3981 RepID=A0A6A6K4T7_HEVBR|nr:hypothetical protein GH714_043528 [Hevea brasiliensis]